MDRDLNGPVLNYQIDIFRNAATSIDLEVHTVADAFIYFT